MQRFFWLPGLISILSFNRHVSYSQLTLLIYSESLSEVSSDKIYYIRTRVFSTEIIFQRASSTFLGDYYCELWLLECIRDNVKHSACLILTSSLFSWFPLQFLKSGCESDWEDYFYFSGSYFNWDRPVPTNCFPISSAHDVNCLTFRLKHPTKFPVILPPIIHDTCWAA